jgi:SAM-dependent methyltransferase
MTPKTPVLRSRPDEPIRAAPVFVTVSTGWILQCPRCTGGIAWTPDSTELACAGCGATFGNEDGITALGAPTTDTDYPAALVELIAAAEPRHFWFTSRNEVILAELTRAVGAIAGTRVLDVGCGTGFVLSALERAGAECCGVDMHRPGLVLAREQVRGPLVWASATSPVAAGSADVVTLCDVIEHLDDDEAVLTAARTAVRRGGYVLVTVPAGQDLWTAYDEAVGHKRRYDRSRLKEVLARSGWHPRRMRYFNILSLVAQRLQRRVSTARPITSAADWDRVVTRTLRIPPAPLNVALKWAVRISRVAAPPMAPRRLADRGRATRLRGVGSGAARPARGPG